MTTSQRYSARIAFFIGATIPGMLFGAAPASADDMGPAPGCAAPMLPQVNDCAGPPLVLIPTPAARPWEEVPPEDPWQDPVITERQVDNTLNQWLPDGWIIGEFGNIIPLRPPEGMPDVVVIPGGGH